jgi:hypothetical protein
MLQLSFLDDLRGDDVRETDTEQAGDFASCSKFKELLWLKLNSPTVSALPQGHQDSGKM